MGERLGVLGGTFDPIHCGHVLLAQGVREQLDLDRVLFIPAADPPHKSSEHLTSAQHRWTMVERALDGLDGLQPSPLEIERGGTSYTVDTLRHLSADHPAADLHLIIGADNVCDLSTWHDPDGILAIARVVAGARRQVGSAGDDRYSDRMIHLDTPLFEVSSTTIRQRLRDGRPIRYLVPPAVEDYIRQHHLYHTANP
ncbi:MAG: nicotinate-nucleotide adenylyltransferase [Gemmatimonadetes bacterium]|jgi:nicotinate-nucleotide adenylyltransferase|nr:nicotinate-nucleotide adenylyltransferase [Gemmatimonadota bacterium]MBT7861803.1 nicotinate-nucleotide adenylyltransferase [Gemmatimonadota bacterium]